MTKTISLEFSTGVFSALRKSPKAFARELRMAAAIHWYQQRLVSLGRAAEVAGINRLDFMDELAHRKIEVFHIDMEDMQKEIDLVKSRHR